MCVHTSRAKGDPQTLLSVSTDYEILSPPVRVASAQELRSLTALPLGLQNASGSRLGRRRSKKRSSLNVLCSRDAIPPFLKRPSNKEVFSACETIIPAVLFTSSTTLPVFGSAFFQLANVSNSASYTALFDQYMIREIEAVIEPVITEVTTVAGDPGTYVTAVDVDDANLPTSYASLCNFNTAVQSRGFNSHYHRWTPQIAIAAYSGTFTSYSAAENQWLDAASPNVQHYAIKGGSGTVLVAQAYILTARFHLVFRSRH